MAHLCLHQPAELVSHKGECRVHAPEFGVAEDTLPLRPGELQEALRESLLVLSPSLGMQCLSHPTLMNPNPTRFLKKLSGGSGNSPSRPVSSTPFLLCSSVLSADSVKGHPWSCWAGRAVEIDAQHQLSPPRHQVRELTPSAGHTMGVILLRTHLPGQEIHLQSSCRSHGCGTAAATA